MEGPYLILLRRRFMALARNIAFLCIHVIGFAEEFSKEMSRTET
jgi:hypothetical protein